MAWSNVTEQPKYVRGTEAGLILPDPAGPSETTVETSNLETDVSGSRFVAGIIVTNANSSANGALNIRVRGSLDDTNWITADTMTLNVDNSGTNSGYGDVDLTNWYLPYWRFQVFSNGTDTLADVTLTVTYSGRDLAFRG